MPSGKHRAHGEPIIHPYERLVGDLLKNVQGVTKPSSEPLFKSTRSESAVSDEQLLRYCRAAKPSVRDTCGKCTRCQSHRERAVSRQVVQSHLAGVTADEMRMLIEILRIDVNNWNASAEKRNLVKQMIQDLPRGKKAHQIRVSYLATALDRFGQKITLCEWHKNLNGVLLNEVFDLVKAEVTTKLDVLRDYQSVVGPNEAEIVRALEVVKGMWTKPWPPSSVLPGSWDYQANKCRACILSRVIMNPDILELFRTTILSRTRTKRKHRAPRLLKFIDACIAAHPTQSGKIWYDGASKAVGLKEARKRAVKLMYKETHAHAHAHRRHRHHRKHPVHPHSEPVQQDPVYPQSLLNEDLDLNNTAAPASERDQQEIAQSFESLEVSGKLYQMDTHNDTFASSSCTTNTTTHTLTTCSPSTPIDHSINHLSESQIEYGSRYVPPRSTPSWREILHDFRTEPGNNDIDIAVPAPLRWNKLEVTGGSSSPHIPSHNHSNGTHDHREGYAEPYRDLVIEYTGADDEESDSQYSQDSWEYIPICEGGPAETTWDLMMAKANESDRLGRSVLI